MSNTSKFCIKIEDIENAKTKVLEFSFDDLIAEIETKGNIKAELKAEALGDFVKISGNVQGVAILQCDLCLDNFEHKIDIEIDELFAKFALLDEYGEETEIKDGQFVTDLKGSDIIDVYDLLYQSVILDFPNKKVCGINCKGGDIFIREDESSQEEVDPRLAIFKDIEIKNSKK